MKRLFKITISVLFVVTIIGMIVYVNLHPDKSSQTLNIFDEMYSEVKSTYQTNNILSKINDLKIEPAWRNDDDLNRFSPRGEYLEQGSPAGYSHIEISFDFHEDNKRAFFDYYKQVNQDERLWFSNVYSYKNKTLTKEVFIQKRKAPSSDYFETIENKKAVKRYLDQSHITAKDLDTYYDQIVNKKILRDWCAIYDSKFSPKNYGKVKIKTQWKDW